MGFRLAVAELLVCISNVIILALLSLSTQCSLTVVDYIELAQTTPNTPTGGASLG